jgi:hypothetical protein
MAKYKSRIASVEAVQFDPYGVHRDALPTGVTAEVSIEADLRLRSPDRIMDFFVTTMDGMKMPVVAGDWIVTEMDGIHHFPLKPNVFAATYEVE